MLNNVFSLIITWGEEKGIAHKGNQFKQFEKLREEIDELETEMGNEVINDADLESIKLEIGDCMVVLTILAHQYGLDVMDCVEAAYKKIKDRKGKTINGTFIKEHGNG